MLTNTWLVDRDPSDSDSTCCSDKLWHVSEIYWHVTNGIRLNTLPNRLV